MAYQAFTIELRANTTKKLKDPFAAWKKELLKIGALESVKSKVSLNDPADQPKPAASVTTLESTADSKSKLAQLRKLGYVESIYVRCRKRSSADGDKVYFVKALSEEVATLAPYTEKGIVLDQDMAIDANSLLGYTIVSACSVPQDICDYQHMTCMHCTEYGADIVKNVIAAELLAKWHKYERNNHQRVTLTTHRTAKSMVLNRSGEIVLVPITRSIGFRKPDQKLPQNAIDLGEIEVPFGKQKFKFHLNPTLQLDDSKPVPFAVPFWCIAKTDDAVSANMSIKYEGCSQTVMGTGAGAVKVRFQLPLLWNPNDVAANVQLMYTSVVENTEGERIKAKGKAKPKAGKN
jgi:hypothetical protein